MSRDGTGLVPEARRVQWLRDEIQRRQALADLAQINELRNELCVLEVAQGHQETHAPDAEEEADPAAAVSPMATPIVPPLNCNFDSMATDEDTSAAAGGDAELHGSVAAAAWHELCVQYNHHPSSLWRQRRTRMQSRLS